MLTVLRCGRVSMLRVDRLGLLLVLSRDRISVIALPLVLAADVQTAVIRLFIVNFARLLQGCASVAARLLP